MQNLNYSISIICATKRPHLFDRILTNLNRQCLVEWNLILCLHGCDLSNNAIKEISSNKKISVLSFNRETSLGDMLNRAVWEVDTPFICKWDDDDYYGKWFLCETIQSLLNNRGDLVGKASWYAWIEAQQSLYQRFVGSENQPQTYLAGGTLAARSALFRSIPFISANLGEDQTLVRDVIQRRGSVWATSNYGYVQVRGDDNHAHAWPISISDYLIGCKYVGKHLDINMIDGTRPML